MFFNNTQFALTPTRFSVNVKAILRQIKESSSYIIIIMLWITLNIAVYFYLLCLQQKSDHLKLELMQNNIKTFLLQDIDTAITDSRRGYLLLVSAEKTNLREPINNKNIFIDQSILHIGSKYGQNLFDLHCVQKAIDRMLPQYIFYNISMNGQFVANRGSVNQDLSLNSTFAIDSNNELSVIFAIDRNSITHANNLNSLYNTYFIFLGISCCVLSLLLYIFCSNKKSSEMVRELLEDALSDQRKITQALMAHNKAAQKLKILFIRKATSLYVNHNLDEDEYDDQIMHGIEHYYCLFPISLFGMVKQTLDLQIIQDDLKNYFGFYYNNVALECTTSVDEIETFCGQAIFYQVIFSLVSNLVAFMENQSNIPKVMNLIFDAEKVRIIYDSFPLNEEQMIYLSNKFLAGDIDVFILNCPRLFKLLQDNRFYYKISSDKNRETNCIEIHLKNQTSQ